MAPWGTSPTAGVTVWFTNEYTGTLCAAVSWFALIGELICSSEAGLCCAAALSMIDWPCYCKPAIGDPRLTLIPTHFGSRWTCQDHGP